MEKVIYNDRFLAYKAKLAQYHREYRLKKKNQLLYENTNTLKIIPNVNRVVNFNRQ